MCSCPHYSPSENGYPHALVFARVRQHRWLIFRRSGRQRLIEKSALAAVDVRLIASTFATSASGYLFPSHTIDPAQIVGGVSLATLVLACFFYYVRRLLGPWRTTYVVSAILAFYLNAFVGVVQAFDKIPFLHPLAPHGSGPVFALVQVALFTLFGALGLRARARFHAKLVP